MNNGNRIASKSIASRAALTFFAVLWALTSAAADQVIEEIVVTAQKREQALQDVPLSVQGLTGNLIDSLSMRDFNFLRFEII